MRNELKIFLDSLLNSYSSIFFTQNKCFGFVLLLITMLYPKQGICGLFCCMLVNAISLSLSLNRDRIRSGLYGFNAVMIGVALGAIYPYSESLIVMIFALSMLVLMLTVLLEGFFRKYNLPFLAFPFLTCLWIVLLLSQQLDDGVSLNFLFSSSPYYLSVGGFSIQSVIEYLNAIELPNSIDSFLKSIGVIFFQSDRLSGLIISIALFFVSRLSFCYALGFFLSGYFCYNFLGIELFHIPFICIGFNFIFTAIAVGGCYIVPSFSSILGLIFLLPTIFIVAFSSTKLLSFLYLPSFSLSFCLVSTLYLYVLRMREEYQSPFFPYIIENTPEENFYYSDVNRERFKYLSYYPISLPFFGEWIVNQGINGEYTHKGEWAYAWDFVVELDNSQFAGKGDALEDYFCYGKPILAPAKAIVEAICDNVEDNRVGEVNKEKNWGNYIILKHFEGCYSVLAHLKKDSIKVLPGDNVYLGQELALCGNSGYSPYPHLHFQFQSLSYIGAPTLHYPLSSYLLNTDKLEWISSGEPKVKDVVSNISFNNLDCGNYSFGDGDIIRVQSERFGEEKWLVRSYQGSQYLQSENGAKAWFVNENSNFYFQRYVGNKESALYLFFLSNYRVLKSTTANWTLTERYPVVNCEASAIKWLQDILAPFVNILQFRYNALLCREFNHSDSLSFYSSYVKTICNKECHRIEFETTWHTSTHFQINVKDSIRTDTILIHLC